MEFVKNFDMRVNPVVSPIAILWACILVMILFAATAQAQSVEPPVPAQASRVSFKRACEAGDKIIISAIGDILPQSAMAEQAYRSSIGFESLWSKLTPIFQSADIAFGNLEGPTAAGVSKSGRLKTDPGPVLDLDVYTGTSFSFNYHPRIVGDLQRSGFDVISMANNHALDRGLVGLDRTIDAFEQRELPLVGARRSSEVGAPKPVVTEARGFRVAWIGCSEAMNGGNSRGAILRCMDDANEITLQIQRLNQDRSIDAVIVAPHWGDEYRHITHNRQRVLARRFLDAGAAAIVGSHPHMLQEMESYRTRDGRDTVIAYSLGNFMSGQGKVAGHKLSALLFIGLTKRPGEKAWVNGVSYYPLWVNRGPHTTDLVSRSPQAPKAEVARIMYSLFDRSRELKAGQGLKTNLECQ